VSVVVSTHRRPGFLGELVAALVDQALPAAAYEVVIVDDGSADGPGGTWEVLCDLVERSPRRMRAIGTATSVGPGGGRNLGVAAARGEVLAFTDDDCLPQPGWLSALLDAIDGGADLVQGTTIPDPRGAADAGPWDRTLSVERATVFFETCNIAYRRSWFDALGGFDEDDPLTAPGGGRHFGEDAVLGARLVEAGGVAAFAGEAVVHHRWHPGSFRDHLAQRRRLVGFPGLARRSRPLRDALRAGIFLSRSTATTDLAVAGVLLAVARRTPAPLLLALPWARLRWPQVGGRRLSGPALQRAGQHAVADLVGAASLVEGSIRHRRVVL
jgi:glycosyltransferase involved in cell wall biosynthesis